MAKINSILEALDKKEPKAPPKGKFQQKELDVLLGLTDMLNAELETEKYTLKPFQRNVVYTMSKGWHTRQKITEGYKATLDEGFFNTSFNTDSTAQEFMINLDAVLGKKGMFEYRKVALNSGDKVPIPGFSFAGFPVKGVIFETRLFKK